MNKTKRVLAKRSRPSTFLASIVDKDPETGERQELIYAGGSESGHKHLTIITCGKTTAWKYTIIIEEVNLEDVK